MKKIYSGLVALLLVLGVTSCGSNKPSEAPSKTESTPATSETTTTPAESKPVQVETDVNSTKILEDADVGGYTILGPATHKIGDSYIDEWGQYNGSKPGTMTATSLSAVNAINPTLAADLVAKKTKALYMIENVEVANTKLAGWKTNWGDEATEIDGAYAIKCGQWMYDEENDANTVSLWVPSKESGKVLTLTPDSYWVTPNFAEDKDANGYDWNTNPVITTGAGKYTVICAKFAEAVDGANFGIGIIQTEALEEFVPAEFDHWKLTGNFGGDDEWKENSNTEAFQFTKEGTLTYEFADGASFKVTKKLTDGSGTWDGALGFANVKDAASLAPDVVDDKGNIKIATAGKYNLSVVVEGETTSLVIAKVAA